jgi:hypothetical protein
MFVVEVVSLVHRTIRPLGSDFALQEIVLDDAKPSAICGKNEDFVVIGPEFRK